MTDMIDEILKADEEALKAKRARLQALAKKLTAARQAISEAQSAIEEVTTHDGLSRAEVARTFDLSSQERRAFMPTKKSAEKPAGDAEPSTPTEQPSAGSPAAF
ncbi:hypothetical protein CIK61_17675 [Brevibacterium aurantiacum]|uniref:hypothetical protein n=1 Tax=Brevibacterium aurantiacum TaxID=273384 RepID=UPI000DF14546|nr:hypothetical protein [Brevibacterium aurantiacum]RCS91626.1 hypothetical protein CIK61_17675 [Brevibacterium aurantiacum]